MIMMTDSFVSFDERFQPLSEDRVPPDPYIDLMDQFHGWKHRGTERFQVQWEAAKITFLFFFNFLGQLLPPQIVLTIKHQSRGVPTRFCTVFLAQFSAFCFLGGLWESKYPKSSNSLFCYPESISFLLNESIASVHVYTMERAYTHQILFPD